MAKCELCQKDILFGRKISITRSQVSRRALAKQKPNVRRVKVVVNGTPCTKYVCTRCLRSGAVTRAWGELPFSDKFDWYLKACLRTSFFVYKYKTTPISRSAPFCVCVRPLPGLNVSLFAGFGFSFIDSRLTIPLVLLPLPAFSLALLTYRRIFQFYYQADR